MKEKIQCRIYYNNIIATNLTLSLFSFALNLGLSAAFADGSPSNNLCRGAALRLRLASTYARSSANRSLGSS